jgi:hypothetical protein
MSPYRAASGTVLVDAPVYLTEQANDYQEDVKELLADYRSVSAFFNDHIEDVDVPVISHSTEKPINYGEFVGLYKQLSDDYDRAGIRLAVDNRRFTETQKTALQNVSDAVADGDIVLFDLLDTGGFEGTGIVPQKLDYLTDLFSENLTVVLNAFQPYEDVNLNYGPRAATNAGADGFGDFVINRRIIRSFPAGNVDRTIRHYFPSATEVNEFKAEDYDTAQTKLTNDPDWDGGHCDFCRRAEREGGHHQFWKEIRMGHYIDSVLDAESV